MSEQISFNVHGDPGTDRPVLIPDQSPFSPSIPHSGDAIPIVADIPGRMVARWDVNPKQEQVFGGATVFAGTRSYRLNGADQPNYPTGYFKGLPIDGRPHEGAEFGIPVLEYGASVPLGVMSAHDGAFWVNGNRFLVKSATLLRAPARLRDGEDLRPVIDQIQEAGGNAIRCSSNLVWANYGPTQPGYWDAVERFWDVCEHERIRCFWIAFEREYQHWTPNQDQQLAFWNETISRMRRRWAIVPDLGNELELAYGLDINIFPRPSGLAASHGSGGTDAPYMKPAWDWAGAHIRRDPPPDARGFAQADHYNYESHYPKPEVVIVEEWMKPGQYGFNPDVAFKSGQRMGINGCGTWHSDPGVQAVLASGLEYPCMQAFYEGMDSAWRA